MKSLIGNAILLGLAVATASVVGCSSSPSSKTTAGTVVATSGDGTTGSVAMRLSLGNDTSINSVNYVLQNGTAVVQSGVLATNNSARIDLQIGSVPAGSGYTITLSAASPDGGVNCLGTSAPFAVAAHSTVNETVQLVCTSGASNNGNFTVIGLESFCGTWQSVSTIGPGIDAGPTNGSEVFADGVTPIVVSATGNGADTSALAYNWTILSQTGGGVTLGANTGNGTTSDVLSLVCNPSVTAGGAVLQLQVTDSDDGGVVTCPSDLSTTTVQVTCDAVAGCPTGTEKCGTGSTATCVNEQSDNNNCGACGNACTNGNTCQAGVCACPTGDSTCSGTCVNEQTDSNNCGTCGKVCASGQSCVAGVCAVAACAPTDFQCQCNKFVSASEVGNVVTPGVCSKTEVTLFQKDVTGACLNCALVKSCIDDNIGSGDVSQECDDLQSATTAPSGATVLGATGVTECQATLSCELGVSPVASPSPLNVSPPPATRALGNAYCGLATGAACQAGMPQGTCVAPIVAGLPATFAAGTQILSNLTNVGFPTGQAGSVTSCLLSTQGIGQCATCVN
jgi:hypothetical protein